MLPGIPRSNPLQLICEEKLICVPLVYLWLQDRLRVACEVVSALVFLHSAPEPIIHMDLKPANLLLSRSLVCKVSADMSYLCSSTLMIV